MRRTTVYLPPYYDTGISLLKEQAKKTGKTPSGKLTSQLVREGLDMVFEKRGLTAEEIMKHLPKIED